MSPQLYQSIKLMELPIMDLREKIEEELERNPALEVLEDRSTISLDAAYTPPKEEDDYFEVSSDSGFVRRGGDEASDEQHQFIEGALSRPETLQEHLLWNLRLMPVDYEIRRIGERLIQNLNEDGFHTEPVALLLKDESPEKIQEALDLVRALDPPGTATTDYRESLLVQAKLLPDSPAGITEALEYLDLLERDKIAEVARKLNRTEDEVRAIFGRIRELSPFPGRQYATEETRYVVPDVQVLITEGEFVIVLNDEEIPVLDQPLLYEDIRWKERRTERYEQGHRLSESRGVSETGPGFCQGEHQGSPVVHPVHQPAEPHPAPGFPGDCGIPA